jgi:hypothetical protein
LNSKTLKQISCLGLKSSMQAMHCAHAINVGLPWKRIQDLYRNV